ncbi:YceI family protein [Aureibaculum sp. 2210JD6-5]|uniref:YceI family protein n=1 Tax=Aureibaculum sp. 2210JD6-5 TaxID=3103957 RepID=UPI002AAEC7FD|nr:YceI family protein [Aureibaculum sp. 2210JD6-5]MDY7396934.1 YceI family protein [Aureibaculum sp. 2210JD6-5]
MSPIKKISIICLGLLLSFSTISCKKEITKTPAKFSVEPKTITVNWTGYKTTDKVPVNGVFQEIVINNVKNDTSAVGALNGTTFDIPVSSLFSKDPIRDTKLKELFFGVMDATVSLTGTLNLSQDGTGNVDLKMNGTQHKIPITYIVSGQLVELEGTLNLEDFKAESALASISEACFDLHKGADGVSKTWSEVGISAAVYLKKE